VWGEAANDVHVTGCCIAAVEFCHCEVEHVVGLGMGVGGAAVMHTAVRSGEGLHGTKSKRMDDWGAKQQ
jgi:hypothetical protein